MNKVAIITGAARGIGAAIAAEFAKAGYAVEMLDILADVLGNTVDELKLQGYDVNAVPIDLANLPETEKAILEIGQRRGRIDVLVNNAATRNLHSIRHIEPVTWNRILAVNLSAPAFLSQWVLPWMEPQGSGVIINIASVEAHIPKGVATAYAVAKGGLLSLTWETAALLSGAGIRVVAISPGAIETDIQGDYDGPSGGKDAALGADMRSESEEMIPMRRWGQPEEIGRAAVWLASDHASYITGTELTIDGGLRHTWTSHSIKSRILPGQFK